MTVDGTATVPTAYRIQETGQRVNALQFDLHLFFNVWAVVNRSEEQLVVRTTDGTTLTLVPVGA